MITERNRKEALKQAKKDYQDAVAGINIFYDLPGRGIEVNKTVSYDCTPWVVTSISETLLEIRLMALEARPAGAPRYLTLCTYKPEDREILTQLTIN